MAQNVIVYDLEIQEDPAVVGWENTFELKMSSCVAYSYATKQYHFFGHTDEERIRCLEFLNGATCVTFNGIKFDSKVLLGNDRRVSPLGETCNISKSVTEPVYSWKNFDIYMKILLKLTKNTDCTNVMDNKAYHGKGLYSLDTMCTKTLGISKNGDGALAPKLFKDGKFYELLQYNLQDVRMTKQLFEFIQEHKYALNGANEWIEFA